MGHRLDIIFAGSMAGAMALGTFVSTARAQSPRDQDARERLQQELRERERIMQQIADDMLRQQQLQLREFEMAGTMSMSMLPSKAELAGVKVDPALREAVAGLDDPDFQVREAATRNLERSLDDRLQLYKLLDEPGLSAEQRYRLLEALRSALLNTPRGAIGIQSQPQAFNVGALEIKVDALLPGLPAAKVLEVGDLISEVDGQPLRRFDDLQTRVQTKKPGDKVTLKVRRARRDAEGALIKDEKNEAVIDVMQLELELGSAELLDRDPERMNGVSRVQASRISEAGNVMRAAAPQPRPIAVRGGSKAFASVPSASPDDPPDPNVDRYQSIRDLLKMRQQIARGEARETDMLRDVWQQELKRLLVKAEDPMLNPQQREFMRRVAERYAQLMEPR